MDGRCPTPGVLIRRKTTNYRKDKMNLYDNNGVTEPMWKSILGCILVAGLFGLALIAL